MRYTKSALVAGLVLCVSGLLASPARAEVSFSAFYSNLSPYGSWQVSAQYGRVWQPVDYHPGWNPYYDGHWAYSDLGWTWVSDYEWGAIPYHYGTWVMDPYYGWVWVPGYVWAPAWVTFRTGPDYIGWAPVSPGFSVGFSAGFGAPASSFLFVSAGNFLAPHIHTCIVPQARTTVIINNTHVVNNLVVQNNIVVNRGPDPRMIERVTGRPLRAEPIEHFSRVMPGDRATRAQLRVDPERARHGLRAAQPVSASSPLPVTRERGVQAREPGRGPATRDPFVTRGPRASRQTPVERESTQRTYRVNPRDNYPSPRDRYRSPESVQSRKAPATAGPVTPHGRSMPQEYRAAPPNRVTRMPAQQSERKSSAHGGGKKPHDSGKD